MWIAFLFVFLFSTGFTAAGFGVQDAGAFILLLVRSVLVLPFLFLILYLRRQARHWGDYRTQMKQAGVGALLHGVYLGGCFAAIQAGMAPGLVALLVTLHPLLTALLSKPLLGVQLNAKQWLGLLLGAIGVVFVLGGGLADPSHFQISAFGLFLCALAMAGISISTLWQKRLSERMGHVEALVCQYLGAIVVFLVACLITGDFYFGHTLQLWLTLAWLVLAISIGAIWLLMIMLERGEAHQVARMFFLIPPLAALQAWLFFNEQWNFIMLVGAALVLTGLVLDRPKRARRDD